VIELKSGTRIWIAAGFTDLRRGFQGLSSIVETVLEQAPFSGHVFVFRGKRGDLINPVRLVLKADEGRLPDLLPLRHGLPGSRTIHR
jgi:hypothetical protein